MHFLQNTFYKNKVAVYKIIKQTINLDFGVDTSNEFCMLYLQCFFYTKQLLCDTIKGHNAIIKHSSAL